MVNTPAVEFLGISKFYGGDEVIANLSLSINHGEFFTLLGPSGSGKTTCLKLVAGFERVDRGVVRIAGEDVQDRPPHLRPVNTVFQDYALFPNMNVIENVTYGLMIRKLPKFQRLAAGRETLAMVRLDGFEERRVHQLSGGQRQRVALARAIINQPKVLLLDEPLGALDLKLREEMQSELKFLQKKLGITFIFVTHDQQEALSMSDRILVINHGRIEQIGTPHEIYHRPRNRFTSEFVGNCNIMNSRSFPTLGLGENLHYALRAEKIRLSEKQNNSSSYLSLEAVLTEVRFHGVNNRYILRADSGAVVEMSMPDDLDKNRAFELGSRIRVEWKRSDMVALNE